jgi:hypothetical protein
MKQDTIKDLQTLAKEHENIKKTILEMCDTLDLEVDIKKKEVIKSAIEESKKQLDDIEHKYEQLLDKF